MRKCVSTTMRKNLSKRSVVVKVLVKEEEVVVEEVVVEEGLKM